MPYLGQNILKIRESLGLSQKLFGKELKVSSGVISHVENDRQELGLVSFLKLEKLSGFSEDEVKNKDLTLEEIEKRLSKIKQPITIHISDKDLVEGFKEMRVYIEALLREAVIAKALRDTLTLEESFSQLDRSIRASLPNPG